MNQCSCGLLTERLYHRSDDGYWDGADSVSRSAYGPIPNSTYFWTGWTYEEPSIVHGWTFSQTFGVWEALVTFTDGWHGWTAPRPIGPLGLEDDDWTER
jgi:hypothetical protein